MIFRPIPTIAVALALAAMGAPVHAQPTGELVVQAPAPAAPGQEIKHETVKFADLDINGPAGAETLVGRLHGAAKHVCSPQPRHRDLKDLQNYQDCTEKAVKNAVAKLGNHQVAQVYARTEG